MTTTRTRRSATTRWPARLALVVFLSATVGSNVVAGFTRERAFGWPFLIGIEAKNLMKPQWYIDPLRMRPSPELFLDVFLALAITLGATWQVAAWNRTGRRLPPLRIPTIRFTIRTIAFVGAFTGSTCVMWPIVFALYLRFPIPLAINIYCGAVLFFAIPLACLSALDFAGFLFNCVGGAKRAPLHPLQE